eukprot:4238392-Prymnesium_polylepis.1
MSADGSGLRGVRLSTAWQRSRRGPSRQPHCCASRRRPRQRPLRALPCCWRFGRSMPNAQPVQSGRRGHHSGADEQRGLLRLIAAVSAPCVAPDACA